MCCEADCVKEDPTDVMGLWYVCDYAALRKNRLNGSEKHEAINPNM